MTGVVMALVTVVLLLGTALASSWSVRWRQARRRAAVAREIAAMEREWRTARQRRTTRTRS